MFLVTSNPRKLAEFRRFGLAVEARAGVDLPEVSGDSLQVILHKALAAGEGAVVEDTILTVGGEEVVDIRYRIDGLTAADAADWVVTLGQNTGTEVLVHRGVVPGRLVRPAGVVPADAFGFDPYFVPAGQPHTLYELEKAGRKDLHSARLLAVQALLRGDVFDRRAHADIPPWSGGWQAKV